MYQAHIDTHTYTNNSHTYINKDSHTYTHEHTHTYAHTNIQTRISTHAHEYTHMNAHIQGHRHTFEDNRAAKALMEGDDDPVGDVVTW